MDTTTTFGVKIDPAGAKSGAKEAQEAAEKMAREIGKSVGKIEKKSESAGKKVSAVGVGAQKAGRIGSAGMNQLANGLGVIDYRLTSAVNLFQGFGRGVANAAGAMKDLGTGAKGASIGLRGIALAGGTVVAILGAIAVAVGALLAVILPLVIAFKTLTFAWGALGEGLNLSGEMEQLTISMGILAGGTEQATKTIQELIAFSDMTHFQSDEIVKAGKNLISFGESTETVIGTLEKLGNISAASGKDIGELSVLFGKARIDGRVMAEDLNQFIEAGIPIIGELAAAMGRGSGEIRKMASDGLISFGTLEKAITSLGGEGGKLWGLLAAQSQSYFGLIGTIEGKWKGLLRTIATPVRDSLKPILQEVVKLLDSATGWAQKMQPQMQGLTDKIAGVFMAFSQSDDIGKTLQEATALFKERMMEAVLAIGTVLSREFEQAVWDFENWLRVVQTPEFWSGMSTVLINVAKGFVNELTAGVRGVLDSKAFKLLSKNPVIKGASIVPNFLTGGAFQEGGLPMEDPGFSAQGPRPEDISFGEAYDEQVANRALTGPAATFAATIEMQVGMIETMREANADAIDEAGKAGKIIDDMRKQAELEGGLLDVDVDKVLGDKDGTGKGGSAPKADPMAKEAERVLKSIETPEQEYEATLANFAKLRDAGYLTSEEFSAASAKAAADYGDATDKIVAHGQRAADSNRSMFQTMMKDWGDLKTQSDQLATGIAQGVSGSMTQALGDIANGTKSAKEAFSDMAASILDQIFRMITQLLIQYAIQSALGMAGGAIAPAAAPAALPVAHRGGIAGDGSLPTRSMAPSSFAGAKRYHSGGTIGPNEQPAILEKGETVLTKKQADEIRGNMGQRASAPESKGTTIINITDRQEILDAIANNPDAVVNAIGRRLPTVRRMIDTGRRS